MSTSDGGPDGGCPPNHPAGTCTIYFVSSDFGQTWHLPVDPEHLAFRVSGVSSPGDSNGDNDVDLDDFAAFHNCETGPDGVANAPCSVFDFDNDQDVDFADFQVIQIVSAWK